jgi:Lon protease-like protein
MKMFDLPLFPLNTVLFPGMPIHLHIFEERYKLMMANILEGDKVFGIALIRNGMEALGPVADPYRVGCTAKIIDVDPYPDGRLNLVALGHERIAIHDIDRKLPYMVCSVESLPIEQPRTLPVVRGSKLLTHYIHQYMRLLSSSKLSDPEEYELILSQLQLPDDHDPTQLLYVGCGLLQIPSSEKQDLLEIQSAPMLFDQVLRIFKRELTIYRGLVDVNEETARRSAWLN